MKWSKSEREKYCKSIGLHINLEDYPCDEEEANALLDLFNEMKEETLPYHDYIRKEEGKLYNIKPTYQSMEKKLQELIKYCEDFEREEYVGYKRNLEALKTVLLPQPHIQKRITPASAKEWRETYLKDSLIAIGFTKPEKVKTAFNNALKDIVK